MNLKAILAGATAAALLPVAASAASVTFYDPGTDAVLGSETIGPDEEIFREIVDADGNVTNYRVETNFVTGDQDVNYWNEIAFTFENNSTNFLSYSVVSGTITQGAGGDGGFGAYGFGAAVGEWFEDDVQLAVYDEIPFSGGIRVEVDDDGGREVIAEYDFGIVGGFGLDGNIEPESSGTIYFVFDTVVCSDPENDASAVCPKIDFTIQTRVSPIPVPAAGFLLLGGLGGLAMMRRRKTS